MVPGRREKMFRAYSARLNNAIPSATKLVQELGADVPGLDTKMNHKMEKLLQALGVAAAKRTWPEDLDLENPWDSAIEILERAKCLGAIDHHSDVNELRDALNTLLRKRGIKFDWTFLKEAEGSRDRNALKNENLLPSIGEKLEALGCVFARVDDGSDNYVFSLCTPESFARIESLASDGYAVRRFSSAARIA